MIIGVGCDIIEISRIKKAAENPAFKKRCFTDTELAYIEQKGIQSAAAFFAAKEAYSKALGTGFRGFSPRDVEINHDSSGKPYVKAYNCAVFPDCTVHVTLSHCREYATAYVILEK